MCFQDPRRRRWRVGTALAAGEVPWTRGAKRAARPAKAPSNAQSAAAAGGDGKAVNDSDDDLSGVDDIRKSEPVVAAKGTPAKAAPDMVDLVDDVDDEVDVVV